MAVFPYSKIMIENKLKKSKYIIKKTKDKEAIRNTIGLVLGDWLVTSLIALLMFVPLTILANNYASNKTLTNLLILTGITVITLAYVLVEIITENRGHNYILPIMYILFMMIPYTKNEKMNIIYGTLVYLTMSAIIFILLNHKLNKNGVFLIEEVEGEEE